MACAGLPLFTQNHFKMSANVRWMLICVRERREMSPKQQRFVTEYLIDLNATKAAARAGYSVKTAKQQGARLLTNADISVEISDRQKVLLTKNAISAENVLKELARVAFFDGRDPSVSDGDGDQKHTYGLLKKVKIADKLRALELLGRHLKMFTDVVEVDRKRDFEVQDIKQKLRAKLNCRPTNPTR